MTPGSEQGAGGIVLRHDMRPGDLGAITWLHGTLYAREYGLDHTFEPYVARPLSEFVLGQPRSGRLWVADRDGEVLGSIAMVATDDPGLGQLRWLILAPDARGHGLGDRMVRCALDYARERGWHRVMLWTFSDLAAAIHLYHRHGFTASERSTHEIWGGPRTEVRMDATV